MTAAASSAHMQPPKYSELPVQVTVTQKPYQVTKNGKTKEYPSVQATLSVPLEQIGKVGKENASLTLVEWAKKKEFHRTFISKNLDIPSDAYTRFFTLLCHGIQQDSLQKGPVVEPTINPADVKIGTPKNKKHGLTQLVATSTLFKGCKLKAVQNKAGEVLFTLSNKQLKKIEKNKKKANFEASIAAIQLQCIAKLAAHTSKKA